MPSCYLPRGTASIGGYAAHAIDVLIKRHLWKSLPSLTVKERVELDRVAEAIRRAAEDYRASAVVVGDSARPSPMPGAADSESSGRGTPSASATADWPMSTAEVAEAVGVSAIRVRQHAQAGRIGVKVGRQWHFTWADVETLRALRASQREER